MNIAPRKWRPWCRMPPCVEQRSLEELPAWRLCRWLSIVMSNRDLPAQRSCTVHRRQQAATELSVFPLNLISVMLAVIVDTSAPVDSGVCSFLSECSLSSPSAVTLVAMADGCLCCRLWWPSHIASVGGILHSTVRPLQLFVHSFSNWCYQWISGWHFT